MTFPSRSNNPHQRSEATNNVGAHFENHSGEREHESWKQQAHSKPVGTEGKPIFVIIYQGVVFFMNEQCAAEAHRSDQKTWTLAVMIIYLSSLSEPLNLGLVFIPACVLLN